MSKKKTNSDVIRVNTIYMLQNLITGKIYIGQTWQELKDRSGNGVHYRGCTRLYSSIKKHGWENFKYTVLYQTQRQDVADFFETLMIEYYGTRDLEKGYNLKTGGNSAGKHSEETKKKISENKKGRKLSEATMQKLLPRRREKRKPFTKERSAQKSQAMILYYQTHRHFRLGTKHSEEAKIKMKESRKRQKVEPRLGKTKFSKDIEALILEDYKENLLTLKQIGEKYGASYSTVENIARRNGLSGTRKKLSGKKKKST